MKKKITFNLIKVSNIIGIDFFNGAIRVQDLMDIMDVAKFNPWSKPLDGYQRNLDKAKIAKIADRTIANLNSPEVLVDAINLNIRSVNALSHVHPINKENNCYGGFHTFNYIEEIGKAFLVDGQHRAKGLEMARDILKNEKEFDKLHQLENTFVNIALTMTEDIFKEAYVFYLINAHAKNVSPEGATRLMIEGLADGNIEFKNEVTSGSAKQKPEDIEGAKIADRLSANSSVWANRIKDYNEGGAGKVSVRAMGMMIKDVFKEVETELKISGSSTRADDYTYQLVETYWEALATVFPDMFDSIKEKNYGITKSSQAEVLMKVLKFIFKVHNKGWKERGVKFGQINKVDNWVKVLNHLKTFKDENNATPPRQVKGINCWLVGKNGSMGKYTSASAKNLIAINICNHLETQLGITRDNPQSII